MATEISTDIALWKWGSIILLLGGVIFWVGAVTPPYKQWATNDVKEYLTIVANNQSRWYFMHGAFITGVILTALGLTIFSQAIQQTIYFVWVKIAAEAFLFGALLVILNFAFRLTVTVWAAKQFVLKQEIPNGFQAWVDWSNLLFAVYMTLAYFSCACVGYALLKISLFPAWLSWFCMIFGISGVISYLVRFILFEPPLMIHLPFIILSITILLKLKGNS